MVVQLVALMESLMVALKDTKTVVMMESVMVDVLVEKLVD